MIKKLFVIAAVLLPLFASAQTLKIGLVDTNAIINAMPETTTANNTLAEAEKKYQAELQRIGEEFQRQYDEFTSLSEDELPAIRERKARQVQETQQKGEAFQQQVIQELQRQQEELYAPIIQKVKSAIESVGRENGFSLIQEMQTGLYFASPVEDITPLVKAKLGLQ